MLKSDYPSKDGQDQKDPIDFFCLCGSEEFEEVTKPNGILGPGGSQIQVYCRCKGCTTRFDDPEKYTSGQKAQLRRIMAAAKEALSCEGFWDK